jgi:DNA-binding NarL/FixJ family response regulator
MNISNTQSPNGSPRLAQVSASVVASTFARRGVAMSNDTIRVILADDHLLVREGLRLLLRTAPDVAVVGEAGDGLEVVHVAERTSPDVIVLDLDMPRRDGESTLRELLRLLPGIRILILTVHPEHVRLLPLLEAGARGYLTKEGAPQELLDAIRVVASGEIYVRPAVARLLATALVPSRATDTPSARYQTLSPRERHVLRAVAEGYSGAEISRALGVSSKTVDAYKRRIDDKLALSHRTDYVRFAIDAGILGPSS